MMDMVVNATLKTNRHGALTTSNPKPHTDSQAGQAEKGTGKRRCLQGASPQIRGVLPKAIRAGCDSISGNPGIPCLIGYFRPLAPL